MAACISRGLENWVSVSWIIQFPWELEYLESNLLCREVIITSTEKYNRALCSGGSRSYTVLLLDVSIRYDHLQFLQVLTLSEFLLV